MMYAAFVCLACGDVVVTNYVTHFTLMLQQVEGNLTGAIPNSTYNLTPSSSVAYQSTAYTQKSPRYFHQLLKGQSKHDPILDLTTHSTPVLLSLLRYMISEAPYCR